MREQEIYIFCWMTGGCASSTGTFNINYMPLLIQRRPYIWMFYQHFQEHYQMKEMELEDLLDCIKQRRK